MALTKLPRNAIGTGAIDNTKIEDGTIQAVEFRVQLPKTNSQQVQLLMPNSLIQLLPLTAHHVL
jgi:hypothetical protein